MIKAIISQLFDLVVPPRRSERLLRDTSLQGLQKLALSDGALPYHEPQVQALVWELKYHGNARAQELAGAYMAELLLGEMAEVLGPPMIVPVPMHPARRRERGHNQTELLCKAALRAMGASAPLHYAPQALRRLVDTKTQQGLPAAVRKRNVRGSIQADEKIVAGRACIVVDDVTTTGATLEECKRALASAGARAVHCIALARS